MQNQVTGHCFTEQKFVTSNTVLDIFLSFQIGGPYMLVINQAWLYMQTD